MAADYFYSKVRGLLTRLTEQNAENAQYVVPFLVQVHISHNAHNDRFVIELTLEGSLGRFVVEFPSHMFLTPTPVTPTVEDVFRVYMRAWSDHVFEKRFHPYRLEFEQQLSVLTGARIGFEAERLRDLERHLQEQVQREAESRLNYWLSYSQHHERYAAELARAIDRQAYMQLMGSNVFPNPVPEDMTLDQLRQFQDEFIAEHRGDYSAIYERMYEPINPDSLSLRSRAMSSKEFARAERRSIELLESCLTPRQQEQFRKNKSFTVVGGHSKKTYLITFGKQMNIFELNKRGDRVFRWCFLPENIDYTGDVMLAQKLSLECDERETLRIANKFDVVTGVRAENRYTLRDDQNYTRRVYEHYRPGFMHYLFGS